MKRRLALVASSLLVGMTGMVVTGAGPAGGQVDFPQADFRGFSSGTVVHAHLLSGLTIGGVGGLPGSTLLPSGSRLLNLEVGFSGATVASTGTDGKGFGPGSGPNRYVNEVDQVVQPDLPGTDLPGDRSFGRGSALEVGLLTPLPTETNTLILAGKAQASAPPSTDVVDRSITVPINPIAYASLLRGQAQANWDPNNCIVGAPLSAGRGVAAQAQLLNTGALLPGGSFANPLLSTDAPQPERAVSTSQSVTRLVPQTNRAGTQRIGDNFGLMTETRITIAPITLFKNTTSQITIEILGEYVLRTVANGLTGADGAYVYFGTSEREGNVPLVRVLQGSPPTTTLELALPVGAPLSGLLGTVNSTINTVLQTVLGPTAGVEISIAESPRAIGGAAGSAVTQGGDGTLASAAVDIVRVRVNPGTLPAGLGAILGTSLLDIRIGHMESRAQVPPGGIRCRLPVTKTSDRDVVNAGETFTYSINVINPFVDCELRNVRVDDRISVDPGIIYNVVGTNPPANSVSNTQVVWNDIGPIPPRQSRTVTIAVTVAPNSGGGRFTDNVTVTGTCATGTAQGVRTIEVPVTGQSVIQVPAVNPGPGGPLPPDGGPDRPRELPRTGGEPVTPLLGLGTLALAVMLRRVAAARGPSRI